MVSYHSYIVQPALTEFRKTEYPELASHGCRLVSSSSYAALLQMHSGTILDDRSVHIFYL